jgi:hypothetical protein
MNPRQSRSEQQRDLGAIARVLPRFPRISAFQFGEPSLSKTLKICWEQHDDLSTLRQETLTGR